MRKKAILPTLVGLALLGPAGLGNSQAPAEDRERADRIRVLRQQLADVEAVGRDEVLRQRGLKPPVPVNTVSRWAAIQALDAGRQKQHQKLLAELRKLGVTRTSEVQSGPQVGEGINGAFSALFLNGIHAGKPCCPV
jgi:hypothetical protein